MRRRKPEIAVPVGPFLRVTKLERRLALRRIRTSFSVVLVLEC